MVKFLIRFLSMTSVIELVVASFDHLEVLADKIAVKVEKKYEKINTKTVAYDKKVVKVTETFNNLLATTESIFHEKVATLNTKIIALANEEKKARTLAKNWKKNMLDGME